MKKYYYIISITIFILVLLPVIALSSLTNLRALSDSFFSTSSGVYIYTGPIAVYDKYAFGNCTYWVSYLRYQMHEPIPNTWGNAITWAVRAEADGYLVDHNPMPGSILQDSNALGGLGHVALVIAANQNSYTISEMNRVGFDEVDQRTLPLSSALQYNFIHNKIL